MSDKNSRHSHNNLHGKSFIILPIIFLFGIYLTIYLTVAPTYSSVISSLGMFFTDTEKNYSTEYKNIFVPVSENSTSDDTVNLSDIDYPKYGEQFGKLEIEDCGIDNKLFFGDGNIPLRNGVGIYNGSFIPGYGKTILVAGHNNTYFNGLKNAKAGQSVNISTSYGNYVYQITDTAIKKASDKSAYDLGEDKENLIMYTCYPFEQLGLTTMRYFVYAKYVSGPVINKSMGDDN